MRIRWVAIIALGLVPPVAGAVDTAVARDDAGSAAAYGQLLCGVAPTVIDAFKVALDKVDPGASASAPYSSAWTQAVRQIDKVRANGSDAELAQVACPAARATIAQRVSF